MMRNYDYAFVGAGNMSKGIIAGMLKAGVNPKRIMTSTKTQASGKRLVAEFGVANTQNNDDCLEAETLILAVKPQLLTAVLAAMNTDLMRDKLIISVIAGIPCKTYKAYLGQTVRLIRTMPNMPSKIGYGMTGLYAENCQADDKIIAEQLMGYTGQTLWVDDEAAIDYVNAISGSGPAYVYRFIQHLAQAGEKLGLSYSDALKLATQTVIGAGHLVEQSSAKSSTDMQALINQITSKGGTTFEAMQSFDNDGLATIIDNAVNSCYQRAVELGEPHQ